ncbi:MAG TPA: lipopolysaccharide biosynthesis protein [Longimicrobium sp.]|nr:lipopolysaccharide biosynthesis protein [Longimicrobium sp.]
MQQAASVAPGQPGPGATALPYALCNLLSALLGMASVVVFTRLLPPAGYGTYAVTLSAAALGQTGLFLWLQSSVLRFAPAAANADGLAWLRAAVGRGYLAASAAALAVWAVLAAFAVPGSRGAAAAGVLVLLTRSWVGIVQNWNRATGRAWRFAAIEAVNGVGMLALAVAGLALRPGDARVPLLAMAAAALASLALAPRVPRADRPSNPGRAVRVAELWAYGMPLSVAALASYVLAASDRLIVAALLGPAAAGAYAVAAVIADRSITVLLTSVAAATKPMVFAEYERGGAEGARALLGRVAGWMMALGFPAATLLMCAPGAVAGVLAGAEMAPQAARVLPWVGAGALLSGFLALHFGLAFQIARRTRTLVLAVAPAAALNVGANLLLLPRYGVIAAAWTTLGGYVVALATALWLGRRHFVVPFPAGHAARTLAACVPLALLARAVPPHGGMMAVALLAGAGAVYACAALALDVAGARTAALAALRR